MSNESHDEASVSDRYDQKDSIKQEIPVRSPDNEHKNDFQSPIQLKSFITSSDNYSQDEKNEKKLNNMIQNMKFPIKKN